MGSISDIYPLAKKRLGFKVKISFLDLTLLDWLKGIANQGVPERRTQEQVMIASVWNFMEMPLKKCNINA
jgi:hypothetical protein